MERRHFDVIDHALRQLPDAAAQAGEIKQQLRDRLFVGHGERPPRIAQYAGRGDLRSWLRVAALRCAMDLFRARQHEVTLPERMLANLPAPADDQELDLLKRKYQEDFKAAFEEALAGLSTRERNVLRYMSAAAAFVLWGRVKAHDSSMDSFFVSVGGATLEFHTGQGQVFDDWRWVVLSSSDWPVFTGPPFQFGLGPGLHVIIIRSREAQSVIDALVVTDDLAFVPGTK